MTIKYKMEWYGGLFDIIVKNRDYQDLRESSDLSVKQLQTNYVKNDLIPYLTKSINEIISDSYSIGFALVKIDFKLLKDDFNKFLIFEIAGDETYYTGAYIVESINDIMRQLYYKVIKDTGVIISTSKMF